MTFKELQDFVLSDRFAESKRDSAKMWLNSRYGRIWAMEPWTFKKVFHSFTIFAGASSFAQDPIKRVEGVWDKTDPPYYRRLTPLRHEDYLNRASFNATIPDAYTVIAEEVWLTDVLSVDRQYAVLGELAFVPMGMDISEPLLPEEFHITLAHGAISEGLRLEADPAWQGAEQDYAAGIENMKQGFLIDVRTFDDVFPSWP